MSISLRRSSRRWRRVTVPEAGLFGLDEARGSRGGANRLARQDEPELASRSRLAVEFDSPAERACRALRDREAETGAAACAVARLVDAVEAVEDALAVLRAMPIPVSRTARTRCRRVRRLLSSTLPPA